MTAPKRLATLFANIFWKWPLTIIDPNASWGYVLGSCFGGLHLWCLIYHRRGFIRDRDRDRHYVSGLAIWRENLMFEGCYKRAVIARKPAAPPRAWPTVGPQTTELEVPQTHICCCQSRCPGRDGLVAACTQHSLICSHLSFDALSGPLFQATRAATWVGDGQWSCCNEPGIGF